MSSISPFRETASNGILQRSVAGANVRTSRSEQGPWSHRAGCLRCLHRYELPKGSLARSGRCPKNGVRRFFLRQRSIEVRQKHQHLSLNLLLIHPIETWPEIRAASTDGIEAYLLASRVDIDLVHAGVEVEYMHALGPLSFEDGADFRLEERELSRAHRAGAVHGDHDLSDALADDSGKIEPLPDMAAIRPRPGVVGGVCLRPGPAQQLAPVNPCLLCAFKAPFEPCRDLADELREGLRLLNGNLPFTCLFGDVFPIRRLWLRRIENLADTSRGYGCIRLIILFVTLGRAARCGPRLIFGALPAATFLFLLKQVVNPLRAHAPEPILDQNIL